ncbi:MAG TPA: hypothetical protein VJ916_02885 [Anaerovoracaceae bacterium]|nr:hypothetical protein [Anaerovoracaceae bacterium]
MSIMFVLKIIFAFLISMPFIYLAYKLITKFADEMGGGKRE